MRRLKYLIRLRRKPQALPVDECKKVFASVDVHQWGKAKSNLQADNPAKLQRENIGAKQGITERHHRLCPWGSIFLCFILYIVSFYGCGYTTRAYVGAYQTIYVAPFKNSINIADERAAFASYMSYYPLLESTITRAVVDRFIFDGSLKVVNEENADIILKGELIAYNRDALRYADNNEDVEEYRITLTANLALYKGESGDLVWERDSFSGDTSYFITGSQAKSEKAALDAAVSDLARRVVEEFVEEW